MANSASGGWWKLAVEHDDRRNDEHDDDVQVKVNVMISTSPPP